MSEDELRQAIEVEQTGYLWTTPHIFTPRLVTQVWGDGRRLMGLTTINNRPAYWVVRVDSGWNVGLAAHGEPDFALGAPDFAEMTDDILTAIEEEYGAFRHEEEFGRMVEEWEMNKKHGANGQFTARPTQDDVPGSWDMFPSINADIGCSWFGLYWPDLPSDTSLIPLPA